jgi:hypothetical protein
MFTRNHHAKSLSTHAIRTVAAIMTLSLFNSSFHTSAQQTSNNPGFTLGFFSIDSKDARACDTANSTLKIEGETLEPGSNNRHKVKLEVTFENGVMTAKDPDNVLRSIPKNAVYGNFYYLTSHLTGHLIVTMKLKKTKDYDDKENDDESNDDSRGKKPKGSTMVDLNFDEFKPLPEESLVNQVPSVNNISEYVDFGIPCN